MEGGRGALARVHSAGPRRKLYAVEIVKSGDVILGGGFGLCCLPNTILQALAKRKGEIRNLTGVSNNAGAGGQPVKMALLLDSGQLSKLMASYIEG